jgi:hypothetical protein
MVDPSTVLYSIFVLDLRIVKWEGPTWGMKRLLLRLRKVNSIEIYAA